MASWTGRLWLYGRERELPAPGRQDGRWVSARTQWRVVRAGLEEVIGALPAEERGMAVVLGREWAYAVHKLEVLDDAAKGDVCCPVEDLFLFQEGCG